MRAKRNDFINRSFRDVADCDYISARACYRLGLMDQFHWLGLRALEKHLKAIILYHDGDTRDISHDLTKALRLVEKIPEIKLDFRQDSKNFLEYLTKYGADRYFTQLRGTKSEYLFYLDEAIWVVRKYCQDLKWLKELGRKHKDARFEEYIQYIQSDECRQNAHKFRLLKTKGHLEEVLDTNKYLRQREFLVWKNFFYGSIKKNKTRFKHTMSGKTPGLFLFPEIYPWAKDRVKLSSKIKNHFEKHITDLSKAKQPAAIITFKHE